MGERPSAIILNFTNSKEIHFREEEGSEIKLTKVDFAKSLISIK